MMIYPGYGCKVFANYFEGYAQTMVSLKDFRGSYAGQFEISALDSKKMRDMLFLELLEFSNSTFDGFFVERGITYDNINVELATVTDSYYSTIENIYIETLKKGIKISNSFVNFDNIFLGSLDKIEYSFFSPKNANYIRCSFNNITNGILSKTIGFDSTTSQKCDIKSILDRNRIGVDEKTLEYSFYGDKVVSLDNYPNTVYKVNTGQQIGEEWLGVVLTDKYIRLDTPYWKTILEQEGIWQDLVTYMNAKRNYNSATPSEKLKQFCIDNNIE